MYAPLLTNRYLTSRIIPFVAVGAVGLCVALVIIVVSVMSGFLDMVRSSGRVLMGDVIVSRPVDGIPWYEDFIADLEARPEVFAATPVVEAYGVLRMPYPSPDSRAIEQVQFWGIEPESFSKVTGYADTLYWRPLSDELRATLEDDDFRMQIAALEGGEDMLARLEREGLALERRGRAAMVAGAWVSQGNRRDRTGAIDPIYNAAGRFHWWLPGGGEDFEVVLSTIPLRGGGASPEPESAVLDIVNEFTSGVFVVDKSRVMIPLELAQELTRLREAEIVDAFGEETGRVDPRRATMVLVRAADGTNADVLKQIVQDVYLAFREAKLRDRENVDPLAIPANLGPGGTQALTWEEQQERFIGPVEKERELMRTIFSLVYLVCAGLVLSIFWAIVYEKTRDIGILRSVGASRLGIAWIFVRYGFVIGLVGALLGVGLGWLVIRNINQIHSMLGSPPLWLGIGACAAGIAAMLAGLLTTRGGRLLPIVLGLTGLVALGGLGAGVIVAHYRGGIVIWDPSVYYFSQIPSRMDWFTAGTTMGGAVLFSVLGAFFPAARAADVDPVQALRYE